MRIPPCNVAQGSESKAADHVYVLQHTLTMFQKVGTINRATAVSMPIEATFLAHWTTTHTAAG